MYSTDYLSIEDALKAPISNSIDYVEFDYREIHYRVYGFLHGVTGAPNKSYRDTVRNEVCHAPGLIIGEHGLEKRSIDLGIGYSLHDYLPHKFSQIIKMGWLMSCFSSPCYNIIKTLIQEKFYKKNPMESNRLHGIVDLCNSTNFHLVHPDIRRQLAGFPLPEDYLKLNINRVLKKSKTKGPRFPCSNWNWLTRLEPYANLPLRSIHMLEYSNTLAKILKQDTVSLFVGEIHQTDMLWLSKNKFQNFNEQELKICNDVKENAIRYAKKYKNITTPERLKFSLGILLGACIPGVIVMSSVLEIIRHIFCFELS